LLFAWREGDKASLDRLMPLDAIREAHFRDLVAMERGPPRDPMVSLAKVKAMAARWGWR